MLISLGLDYTHADVGTRESFHLTDDEVANAYARGSSVRVVREFMAVNTCNRIELYGWATSIGVHDPHAEMALRYFGRADEASRFMAAATHRNGRDAVRHLLRVTTGLESQILGDIHIIGQLRNAYRIAARLEVLGANIHRLMDTAIRAGKRVKRETDLMVGRSSVGSEAATAAHRRLDGLTGRRVVVVGAGKIGTHAAQSLIKQGADDVVLLNRTRSKAQALADSTGARVGEWARFNEIVGSADAVIVATGAPAPILTAASLAGRADASEPLLVVDISMPRNVDPTLRHVPGVTLIDLDQLHPEAASVARARRASVPDAEAVVEEMTEEYLAWVAQSGAREALRPLREKLEEICRRELEYATGADTDVDRAATRIVSKLMAQPMTVLREQGGGADVAAVRGALHMLFSPDSLGYSNRTG